MIGAVKGDVKALTSEKRFPARREPLVLIGKRSNNIESTPSNRAVEKGGRVGRDIIAQSLKENPHIISQSLKENLRSEISSDGTASYRAKAKFTYAPTESDELAFSKNDLIDIFGPSQVPLPNSNARTRRMFHLVFRTRQIGVS